MGSQAACTRPAFYISDTSSEANRMHSNGVKPWPAMEGAAVFSLVIVARKPVPDLPSREVNARRRQSQDQSCLQAWRVMSTGAELAARSGNAIAL